MNPVDTAQEILRRAGAHQSDLFVYTPGTQPIQTKCGTIADTLSLSPHSGAAIEPDPTSSRTRAWTSTRRAPGLSSGYRGDARRGFELRGEAGVGPPHRPPVARPP